MVSGWSIGVTSGSTIPWELQRLLDQIKQNPNRMAELFLGSGGRYLTSRGGLTSSSARSNLSTGSTRKKGTDLFNRPWGLP